MARIGDVEIYVIDESRMYNNKTTDHPVEEAQNVADHVENDPIVFRISGEYTGEDAAQVHSRLIKMRNERQPVTYIGRGRLINCVIESFTENVDSKIANGFRFTMTLKQIRIAKTSVVNLLTPNVRAQVKEVENKGRIQAS